MSKTLLMRFSAIGDVALSIPVVYSYAEQYPKNEIVMLTDQKFESLFSTAPKNVMFKGVDLKGKHHNLLGLIGLARELEAMNFTQVVDFHDVLRTQFLRTYLRLNNVPVKFIHKARRSKKALIRKRNKHFLPLKSTLNRYLEVLTNYGYDIQLNFTSLFKTLPSIAHLSKVVGEKTEQSWVGLAPFAAHEGKIYPLDKMEQVLQMLAQDDSIGRIFLFGGGTKEKAVFDQWVKKYPHVISLAGQFSLLNEVKLMAHLDVMIAMDSANMHLASLVNLPVVSIWGQTHPHAGFYGYGQNLDHAVQIDLECRPCSIYGNKACYRKDFACMQKITPEMIISRVKGIIK